jgi:hypothetical protein
MFHREVEEATHQKKWKEADERSGREAEPAAPNRSSWGVQNETDEVSPEREYGPAPWDALIASGDLPLCSVQSVAANESIYLGVEEYWKRESSPAFFSGRSVANGATSGFSVFRLPIVRILPGPQRPIELDLLA